MPAWYSPTASSGQGYFINQMTATTACANTYWVVNTCTAATTATTTCYIDQYQNQIAQLYQAQAQQAMLNALYGGNQPQVYQPQISREEQERRNAQREQSLYDKALAEHNDQEAARLRRLIDAREQAAATQRAIDEQRRVEREAEQARLRAAEARANELLCEHLTPVQKKTYKDNGWFVIEGGKTKTKYRINGSHLVGNVDVLDNQNRKTHRLCAHVRQGTVPMGDQLLAQKIMLEHDEDAFIRVANRHAA